MQVKCEIKSFLISVWLTTNVIHVLSCKRMLERESWLAYVDCSLLSDEKIMGVKVVILARFKRLKPVRFNVDFQQTNFLIEQIVLFNEFCLHSTSSLGLLSLFRHDKQKKRWGKVFFPLWMTSRHFSDGCWFVQSYLQISIGGKTLPYMYLFNVLVSLTTVFEVSFQISIRFAKKAAVTLYYSWI